MNTPRIALSIRQPWAWLIIAGWKPLENRTWWTSLRGRVYIHAARGMTLEEYLACRGFALGINPRIAFPMAEHLDRGGVIGSVEIVGCVLESDSPWFVGPKAFVMERPEPLPFKVCRGMLGFFEPEFERQLL